MFASAARVSARPTINELYSPGFGGLFAGNPDLDPERSHSVEARGRLDAGRASHRRSRVRTAIRDLIDFSGGEKFQAINVKRAEIDGAGARVGLAQRDRLDARRNGHVRPRARRRQRCRPRAAAAPKLVARLGQEIGPELAWGVDAQYASGRRDFGGTLDPYTVVAGWVDWRFASDWRAGMRLDNAFDREYALVAGYATPGRSFLLDAGVGARPLSVAPSHRASPRACAGTSPNW